MVSTLGGRIQTRVFLLLVVGVCWTLALTPVLPGMAGSLGQKYGTTFMILLTVGVLGVGWELVYHGLQQFRWDKDWPTLFGLLTMINEGLLVVVLLRADLVPFVNGPEMPLLAFILMFVIIWLAVWLTANGPMRLPFLRWRFRGGRLL